MTRWGVMVGLQVTGVMLALTWLVLRPTSDGLIWLIPLTPAASERLLPDALADGGRIVARGPLPGSLIVAESARLPTDAGVLVLAAPAVLCGGEQAR